MKIFHCLESYYPAVGGMQVVTKILSELLAGKGHEVYVLTRHHPERKSNIINGVRIIPFHIEGNPIEPDSEECLRYQQFILQEQYDVITFFASQQWATNLALPLLKHIRAKKVNVPTGYSGLYWEEFLEYYQKMKTYIHHFDANVYLSNNYRDINFARDNNVKNIYLIPNGAMYDEFMNTPYMDVRKTLGLSTDTFLFLHVGSFNGWKGHDELIQLYSRLDVSGKNTALLMIGDLWNKYRLLFIKKRYLWSSLLRIFLSGNKKMIAGEFSRSFTVNAFRQADLFVFPSNVECSPIVLFECAAGGIPFVASDVGNCSEIAGWTEGGYILPTHVNERGFGFIDIPESVCILNSILKNDQEIKRKGKISHEIWKEKFTWEKIADRYEELYRNLVKK